MLIIVSNSFRVNTASLICNLRIVYPVVFDIIPTLALKVDPMHMLARLLVDHSNMH